MSANLNSEAQLTLEIEDQSWPLKDGDVIGRLGTVGGESLRKYDVLSRQHLRVEYKTGRWQMTLLPKAGNETICNGMPMTTATPVVVTESCVVQVAALTLRLVLGATPLPDQAEHPAALLTLDKQLQVVWRNRAAIQLLGNDLAPGTEFLRLLETGATLTLRYALMGLRDGAELNECEVASHTADGIPWLALRASRHGGELFLALRDVTLERQQRAAVEQAAERLDTRLGALATLLTAGSFVEGDLAAALPLLVADAAELLDDTHVSAWLPSPAASRTGGASLTLVCRATAGAASHGSAGKEVVLGNMQARGEASPTVLATLRVAGMLEETTASAWLEPMDDHGLLVFQRNDPARPWQEPETRLMALAVALGRQLFANAQRRDAMETLRSRETALSAELGEAAQYAEQRLPAVITRGHVAVDWVYQPCGRLGGDNFGYEWLDDQWFAIYIADVMGHGSKAALHALTLSQRLKLLLARETCHDPATWLSVLNKEFPMKANQDLLWTMWCGLYDRRSRTLRHVSGGHPPALLCEGGKVLEVNSPGPVLGAVEDSIYRAGSVIVPKDSKLFLFTDGVYEFPTAEGETGTLADFSSAVGGAATMANGECSFLKTRAAGLCVEPNFPDDFTIVRVQFAR
jgi:serine phosphatase RsbU (regulator of sigma subunit)